ncbi:DegT/DnrJ/EryC1/StrS family aminotransferase [Paenibacillus thermotolerans]|uniref:DegT/DnrJ/EryC1/StrS family aminotransferase n=1 Tax=Paenibacillus thermotolerans TaxID=3027807 RepID=UPI002368038A|nr:MULTISPECIES: DegT/DnrJ/EryC1/StrS family aminotransferase [unclassified Paenibacillus]
MIELVPLRRQFQSLKADILRQIEDTIDSGTYILGPKVKRLEETIADRLQVTNAIGVANGTDALVLTLDAMGIGPGDEVITTPFTFIATAEAISRVGAVPVFVDISPVTYNMNPALIEEKITPATKAIIPVHLFGQPADMDEIMAIAAKHGLRVIEDACQAFGAEYKGKPVGGIGHAACFSFFPTKNLSTIGDAGIVATSDERLAERIRRLRQHGSNKKYFHADIGYNSRLDELHASILLVALEQADGWNRERRRLAERYREKLKGHPLLSVAPEAEDRTHIYHLFCVRTEHREALQEQLQRSGIQSGVYYPCPLHLQEAYKPLGYRHGDFQEAERASEQLLAIPISPFLHEDEQDQVVDALFQVGGRTSP